MTGTAAKQQKERKSSSSDERLIKACLKGDAEAWAALIDKYKNLIYSIPIKFGMHQDASDIFQVVCVDLMSELKNLREHRALPKWLMETCYHRCLQHRRQGGRLVELTPEHTEKLENDADQSPPEQMLAQLEQEQLLRAVIASMPERCERMIHMLFYEIPPRPYDQIASELGVATGSIGFIRGRCLDRLRKQLEKRGF
jgi:RNA polymerase sigma factor (sigma-70 family)